eukprot:13153135-Heterocapsa_arctica.AAC.1
MQKHHARGCVVHGCSAGSVSTCCNGNTRCAARPDNADGRAETVMSVRDTRAEKRMSMRTGEI